MKKRRLMVRIIVVIFQFIGKIILGIKRLKQKCFIYIAKNWDENSLSYIHSPNSIVKATVIYPRAELDHTHKISLMFKHEISYTQLREYFYQLCHNFEQDPTSGYLIELFYKASIYDSDNLDPTIYRMNIDFLNNTIHKFLDEYQLIEEILFDQISFELPQQDSLQIHNSYNFLAELESLSGI